MTVAPQVASPVLTVTEASAHAATAVLLFSTEVIEITLVFHDRANHTFLVLV